MSQARDHIWGPTAAATALLRGSEVTPLDWLCSIAAQRGRVVEASSSGFRIGNISASDPETLADRIFAAKKPMLPRLEP